MENFHILTVKYIGPSNFKGSRVKITSDRFDESKTIEYDHSYDSTLDMAVDYLRSKKGFEIVGFGESKDGYFVVSNTFDHIK